MKPKKFSGLSFWWSGRAILTHRIHERLTNHLQDQKLLSGRSIAEIWHHFSQEFQNNTIVKKKEVTMAKEVANALESN